MATTLTREVVITCFYRPKYKSKIKIKLKGQRCLVNIITRKYHSHKTLRETLFKMESEFPDIAEVNIAKNEKVFNFCHIFRSPL